MKTWPQFVIAAAEEVDFARIAAAVGVAPWHRLVESNRRLRMEDLVRRARQDSARMASRPWGRLVDKAFVEVTKHLAIVAVDIGKVSRMDVHHQRKRPIVLDCISHASAHA